MDLPSSQPLVHATALEHRFPAGTLALSGLNLEVPQGEFLAIVGPSGCGKSTLLRLLAGLLAPSAGKLSVNGVLPAKANQGSHRCGFVFQSPTLLPWRRIEANVRLPLELLGLPKAQARQRAQDLLAMVGLSESAKAFPAQLSGGMRMRVSIARALAVKPSLLLLDEPFAALDDITRNRLQEDLLELRRKEGFTTVLVTHNVAEAAFLADRVLVMTPRPGRITADIAIPFGTNRDTDLRTSPAMADLLREISHRLKEAMA
ncbi:MAG: hypothetical protein RL318_2326 [Fibrobacterota bacterium]|jgi:NitT/TauT family transport system ATP-binding protein